MIPSTPVASIPGKPNVAAPSALPDRAQATETARTSAGETAASKVQAETANAISAPKQAVVAARLREQETTERTARAVPDKDAPAGPPPTFEESPLERQVRVALDPPDQPLNGDAEPSFEAAAKDADADADADAEIDTTFDALAEPPRADPPPTKTEKAEAGFAETREMAEPKEPAQVDQAG